MAKAMDGDTKAAVSERYGEIARRGLGSGNEKTRTLARAFGYTDDDLSSIPAKANLGVGCGNPTAMASLREGETVVDLGSGGGLDVFLAARKVGPRGRAIGIDMTADMVRLAERNAAKFDLRNVSFHLAEIDALPLAGDSVDCVISNCVMVLVPDKPKAFAEILRVLRPGGRLAISDIALKKALPPDLVGIAEACTGCIDGALTIAEYEAMLAAAGFTAIQVVDSGADLNLYRENEAADLEAGGSDTACCGRDGATPGAAVGRLDFDINKYAASVKVFALK
jgi:SAM-dependent methyltransferase